MILRVLALLAAGFLLPRSASSSPVARSAILAQNQTSADPSWQSAFELEWSAPAECPDGDAIRSEVMRLTGATTARAPQLKAQVAIRPTATGWALSLATEMDGVTGERALSGASCESLADAAAVMLALILNQDLAQTASPPSLEKQPAPQDTTLASGNEQRRRLQWSLGAHGGVQIGVLQNVSSSFGLSLGGALRSVALRLTVGLTLPQDVLVPDIQPKVGGRLWLGTAAVLGCWATGIGPVALSPCLGANIARLQGQGLGVRYQNEVTVYWSSAELAVFVGLPVGHSVSLEAGGIGLLPFSRPRLYLDKIGPVSLVSRPAAFGFRASAGIAWNFK